MTDASHRASFLPVFLLLLGVVVFASVVLAFAPIVNCPDEYWHQVMIADAEEPPDDMELSCETCSDTGKVTLRGRWFWLTHSPYSRP